MPITEIQIHSNDFYTWASPLISDFAEIEAGRRVNEVGRMTLRLPLKYWDYTEKDNIIEVYRQVRVPSTGKVLDTVRLGNTFWFIYFRRIERKTKSVVVYAKDAIRKIDAKVVAQYAGVATAANVYADNLMKTIFSDQNDTTLFSGGSAITVTGRDWSNYIAIEANLSAGGALIDKSYAYRKSLVSLFRELSDMSVQAGGNFVAFDLVPYFSGTSTQFLQLQTFANQRGKDRSSTATNTAPVILSADRGNLIDDSYSEDYGDEITMAYAAGQDTGTSRIIRGSQDTSREIGVLSLVEDIQDARNSETANKVLLEAKGLLYAKRSKKSIRGRVRETDTTMFDKDFGFGDKVSVEFSIAFEDVNGNARSVEKSADCYVEAFVIRQAGAKATEELDILLESVV